MNKNRKLLLSFFEYCDAHPEERFWQALRNWSGFGFILASEAKDYDELNDVKKTHDTWEWEEKNQ